MKIKETLNKAFGHIPKEPVWYINFDFLPRQKLKFSFPQFIKRLIKNNKEL